ncbi:MAG: SDR family oxidoreductase [Xenococcaceae cyanobacterium MO_188.B19]|nr:SDR family oxidoreductase [Xenococcaceae cyanobacterium MO_188.B19]
MKAFVTGSTGLLGNNLIHLLLEQGYQVKALVRSPRKAEQILKGLDVTFVQGDLNNIDRFASQLADCDVLFHCAAYFREYYQPGNHWKKLVDINVAGTVQLLEAAEKQGVKKAIYVSSSGVIGKRANGKSSDETTPPNHYVYNNLYFKSKLFAEEAVAKFLQHHQLPTVLILPGWMFGPRDFTPTDSGRIVLDFLQKKLPGIIDGGSTVVDARDVAQAMIQAVTKGKSGERYIVGGHFMTLKDINQHLEKLTGIAAPKLHIPHKLLMFVAFLSEIYGRITKQPILLSRVGLQTLHAHHKVSSAKAQQELDVYFRPFSATLKDESAWMQAHHRLKHRQ